MKKERFVSRDDYGVIDTRRKGQWESEQEGVKVRTLQGYESEGKRQSLD